MLKKLIIGFTPVANDHGLVSSFIVITSTPYPHSWLVIVLQQEWHEWHEWQEWDEVCYIWSRNCLLFRRNSVHRFFCGVRVAQCLASEWCCVDNLLTFWPLFFITSSVPFSNYVFLWPLLYLLTFFNEAF